MSMRPPGSTLFPYTTRVRSVISVLSIGILLINIRQPQIFTVLTSIAIIMVYLAYRLVTVPMLLSRLRGRWPVTGERSDGRLFSLGRWGLPVNVLAVLWGAGMALNLAWPRREVYNATEPYHWYLQWGAFVFIGAIALVGLAYFLLRARHNGGVLPEHAADAVPGTPASSGVAGGPAVRLDDPDEDPGRADVPVGGVR